MVQQESCPSIAPGGGGEEDDEGSSRGACVAADGFSFPLFWGRSSVIIDSNLPSAARV